MNIRIVLALILTAAIAVGCVLGFQQITAWRSAAIQNEQRGGVMVSTDAGIKQGENIDALQEAYNRGLSDGRDMIQQTKDEAKRNEPETAARAVRNVPVSVRNAYSERRRARERLGCTARECREDDETDAAAKR